jgi:hypothetical protein
MGYTNYWKPNKAKIDATESFPKEMLEQMEKVRAKFNDGVMSKEIQSDLIGSVTLGDTICLTGTCEGFEFDLCKDSRTGDRIGVDSWKFCKTCREPYDMAVKCFLMLLQRYGFITEWSHDDNNRCDTYKDAIKFAKKCGIDTRGVYAKR